MFTPLKESTLKKNCAKWPLREPALNSEIQREHVFISKERKRRLHSLRKQIGEEKNGGRREWANRLATVEKKCYALIKSQKANGGKRTASG